MKHHKLHLLLLAGCAAVAATCARIPEFPVEPVIEYKGISQNRIEQSRGGGIALDTIEIRFSFTDGDGDIGSEDSVNIFLQDSRDGSIQLFKVNPIPKLGAGNGLRGEIKILMTNSAVTGYFCCTFPNTFLTCLPSKQHPSDTLSYQIFIRDRAGNISNKIRTEKITILCN
ncbi:MAG: hypothetical protein RL386_627 [Bacteroidota bacterium]